MAELALNDHRLKRLRLQIPPRGAWVAEVQFDGAQEVDAGPATLDVGGVLLRGFVMPEASGAYLVTTRARLVGGAGGWRSNVPERHYHNDAGVSVANVLSTTAAAVGETLATPLPTDRLLAVDWVRFDGRASQVLERLAPDWWVDLAGVTHLTKRSDSQAAATVEVKAFDVVSHVAELRVAGVNDLTIGSLVANKFSSPRRVRALEFEYADVLRVGAWLE